MATNRKILTIKQIFNKTTKLKNHSEFVIDDVYVPGIIDSLNSPIVHGNLEGEVWGYMRDLKKERLAMPFRQYIYTDEVPKDDENKNGPLMLMLARINQAYVKQLPVIVFGNVEYNNEYFRDIPQIRSIDIYFPMEPLKDFDKGISESVLKKSLALLKLR